MIDSSLSVLVPSPHGGIGRLTATIEGHFDRAFQLRRGRRVRIAEGYGHAALFHSRLVVDSASTVEVVPPRSAGADTFDAFDGFGSSKASLGQRLFIP